MKLFRQLFVMSVGFFVIGSASAKPLTGDDYLAPHLKPAHPYSNVFSISRSIRADGYDELVRRNGGSADYTVTSVGVDSWQFMLAYHYDGQPAGAEVLELRDGGRIACNDGKCAPNSDASGLIYNPVLWGKPPRRLTAGLSWSVSINTPWELGGQQGTQTVTVVSVDPAAGTATLMRVGSSQGYFLNEPKQVKMGQEGETIVFDLIPGVSHWRGYTTFARGVVISDELMATRADVLRSKEGKEIAAFERRIMLLNASPTPEKRA